MKEEMKMPGFTADASLYKPRRHYNFMVKVSGDGHVIIPQTHIPDLGPCWLQPCGDGECMVCMMDKYFKY